MLIGTKGSAHRERGGGGGYRRRLTVGALLVSALGFLPAPPARAAGTAVGCGDSASLRDAVAAANQLAGPDYISLAKGCTYKFVSPTPFSDAALVVTDDLVIYGNGAKILRSSDAPSFRHFDVRGPGGRLTLNDVTLTGGKIKSAPTVSFPAAGAILVGAGGTLIADRLTVKENVVKAIDASGPVGSGGILVDGGTVTLKRSTIKANIASAAMGDAAAMAGGIAVTGGGAVTLYKTVVTQNQVSMFAVQGPVSVGGGLAALDDQATVAIDQGSVAENLAVVEGGGGASGAGGLSLAGITTLKTTQITGNVAKAKGTTGAALGGGIFNRGQLMVDAGADGDGSDVTENQVSCPDAFCSARGGGYAQDAPSANAEFNLTAFRDNLASAPKGAAWGGGLYVGDGTITLTRSVVKHNTAAGKMAEGGGIFAGSAAGVTFDVSDVAKNKPHNCFGVLGC